MKSFFFCVLLKQLKTILISRIFFFLKVGSCCFGGDILSRDGSGQGVTREQVTGMTQQDVWWLRKVVWCWPQRGGR